MATHPLTERVWRSSTPTGRKPARKSDEETALTPEQRKALLDDPSSILMDRDLMRAIVGAHEDGSAPM